MASLNPVTRELVFKIVFCGPGMGGKTTTLERLHENAAPEARGQLVSLSTEADRTLYFDFLPLRLPKVRGMHVRLQLFTVPGQVHYAATRKLVLTGCDGVVFVADAQRVRAEANQESLEDLDANLVELRRSLASTPHVMQWNKMDLADVMAPPDLEARFNKHKAPSVATVALTGQGIQDTLDAIARLVIESYMAAVPSSPQKFQLRPEGGNIANAVRDWTEGRSAASAQPGATSEAPTDRDQEERPRDSKNYERTEIAASNGPILRDAEGELGGTGDRPTRVSARDFSVVPITARAAGQREPRDPSSKPPSSRDGGFSLAEVFPDEARTDVRGIEDLLTRGDTRGAVLAADMLVTRALATLAPDRATAWLLAGLDAGNYRTFRAIVDAVQKGANVEKHAALSCLVWAANAALAVR